MKDDYKELRKKLKDVFFEKATNNYGLVDGVGTWMKKCSIKPTEQKLQIICNIFGSIPYPYQQSDRLAIVQYLKNNKYKDYKNEFR